MRKMLKRLMGIQPPPVKTPVRAEQKPAEATPQGEPIEKTAEQPITKQES